MSLLVLLLLLLFPVSLRAQQGDATSKGKAIFESRCSSCHTVGGGELVGPDLRGVTARRDSRWLKRFIRQPDVMIREKDPIALGLLEKYYGLAMPNLGISENEAGLLLAYLSASGKPKAAGPAEERQPAGKAATGQEQPAPAAAAQQPLGSASIGAAIFNGTRPLQNRGAQCFACHNVAAIAPPGGGSLGPDLTDAFKKYGGARGFEAALTGMPFPTMSPVYHGHVLTPQEEADLAAYLGAAAAGLPASNTIFVASLGLWVLAGLYVILHSLWRGRLGRVRASLPAR
jgi:mono/diheme cytochrome c family protein